MKNIFFYIITALMLVAAACEKEFPLSRVGNTDGLLCLNGYLYADSSNNYLVITATGENYPIAVRNARVEFSVNGEVVEVIDGSDSDDGKYYHIKSVFHPGDKVRIDAYLDGQHAWVEDVAPQRINDLGASIEYRENFTYTNNDGGKETDNCGVINVKFSDDGSIKNYYMLNSFYYHKSIFYSDWHDDIVLDSVLVWTDGEWSRYKYKCMHILNERTDYYRRHEIIYGDEIILKDNDMNEATIDFTAENPFESGYDLGNVFRVFSDMRFDGAKCDLTFLLAGYTDPSTLTYRCENEDLSDSIFAPTWYTTQEVEVCSITESCYLYLKSMSGIVNGYYESYDALIGAVKVPSNVNGGSGTVSVITSNVVVLTLCDGLKPKPVYTGERDYDW